ncbi:hypothetical protein X271_00584 [Candidatus Hepatoplasma crinochetorum Av]|uniref:DUF3800 domain-containing protein n=2 Tax=Candidatus Hepatoplasma crinochetorum TaxID=295596 RepID=W8GTB3_9MOLU|nr:hypothetical protein X271_00584 [Candidatus Hepatoplasma crinochetorum Av]BDV03244.1 MAG: hypothetical protein HCTKY_5380 [Candidatus Hepatoplasma crinochetorum]
MKIYMYIDESGVLHKNDYYNIFLFGGICFINENLRNKCKWEYGKRELEIKNKYPNNKELKGNTLKNKHKKYLYSILNGEKTFIGKVNINKLKEIDWQRKKSIQKYKDWFLMMLIKEQVNNLIIKKEINVNEKNIFHIFVDNQNISIDEKNNLTKKINQEFFKGKYNNKKEFIKPIFNQFGKIKVKYVNSETNELIRAADILCNNKFNKIKEEKSIEGKHVIFSHP